MVSHAVTHTPSASAIPVSRISTITVGQQTARKTLSTERQSSPLAWLVLQGASRPHTNFANTPAGLVPVCRLLLSVLQ
jgi:hypothetical protein